MTEKTEAGRFIVFEGIDGSGKSSQVRLLGEELKNLGVRHLLTAEHTRGTVGMLIEDVVRRRKTLDPESLQICFVADRVAHWNEEVSPALKDGRVVVSDRFYGSTVAYGGAVCDPEILLQVNRLLVPDPELTILVDVAPEVAMARMDIRGEGKTIFEKKERLEGVRERYKWLAEKFGNAWVTIDGSGSEAEVHELVMKQIRMREVIPGII